MLYRERSVSAKHWKKTSKLGHIKMSNWRWIDIIGDLVVGSRNFLFPNYFVSQQNSLLYISWDNFWTICPHFVLPLILSLILRSFRGEFYITAVGCHCHLLIDHVARSRASCGSWRQPEGRNGSIECPHSQSNHVKFI